MHNQPQAFNDAKGTTWTLTALLLSTTQFVLESLDSSITIMAHRAAITIDESKMPNPFVLELDNNASLEIDPAEIEKLDEFLQQVTGVSA